MYTNRQYEELLERARRQEVQIANLRAENAELRLENVTLRKGGSVQGIAAKDFEPDRHTRLEEAFGRKAGV